MAQVLSGWFGFGLLVVGLLIVCWSVGCWLGVGLFVGFIDCLLVVCFFIGMLLYQASSA